MLTRHARAIEEDRDKEAALHLAPAEDDDVPGADAPLAKATPRAEQLTNVDRPRDAPPATDDGAQL